MTFLVWWGGPTFMKGESCPNIFSSGSGGHRKRTPPAVGPLKILPLREWRSLAPRTILSIPLDCDVHHRHCCSCYNGNVLSIEVRLNFAAICPPCEDPIKGTSVQKGQRCLGDKFLIPCTGDHFLPCIKKATKFTSRGIGTDFQKGQAFYYPTGGQ